jgi:3'-phosphoadenosine 5'-phosphosulfate (PAPS) 3'-phosphatase
MAPDGTAELLLRIFAVNEQIVRQNHEILSVLTNPRITKDWKALTADEVKQIVANAQSIEWAVLMADSTIKAKNI